MRGFLRLTMAVLIATGIGVALVSRTNATALPVLNSGGVGAAHFGEPKLVAVEALSQLLGPPTSAATSSGCGPRYSEVEWGDLAVEFRLGIFSGYRYRYGGLGGFRGSGAAIEANPAIPALSTAQGITLGSTLGQVRTAYGQLMPVGINWSEASSGLLFSDDARAFPDPPSSRIIEIKIGTCGDD